jgi:hypothetical protein
MPWRTGPLTVPEMEELIKDGAKKPLSMEEHRQYVAWLDARGYELWGRWGRKAP